MQSEFNTIERTYEKKVLLGQSWKDSRQAVCQSALLQSARIKAGGRGDAINRCRSILVHLQFSDFSAAEWVNDSRPHGDHFNPFCAWAKLFSRRRSFARSHPNVYALHIFTELKLHCSSGYFYWPRAACDIIRRSLAPRQELVWALAAAAWLFRPLSLSPPSSKAAAPRINAPPTPAFINLMTKSWLTRTKPKAAQVPSRTPGEDTRRRRVPVAGEF